MKILCVIDSFGSGGAQKQMVNLACGLKSRGHDVEIFVYFSNLDFFRRRIVESLIPVHESTKKKGFSLKVLWRLASLMRTGRYDYTISFLATPSVYCELAKLLSPYTRLIVSERNSNASDGQAFSAIARRLLHFSANHVVTNSETHGNWLRRFPWLRQKTTTIYNGYEIPPLPSQRIATNAKEFRYLVIGRVHPQKNGLLLIKALILFFRKNGRIPAISWAGRREGDSESLFYLNEMENLLAQYPLISRNWCWLGERDDVPHLLATHNALLHPSLYEGLPNVICEAFIAGCPVIASNVCDHPLLVEEGVRGLLFDPLSPESICNALERFEKLTEAEIAAISHNARKYAEEKLTIERMVNSYEALLQQ